MKKHRKRKRDKMIKQIITLSTAHISEGTAELLKREPKEHLMEICVYSTNNGWFIPINYLTNDRISMNIRFGNTTIPYDLRRVINYAKVKGCDWIYLNHEVEKVSELPEYNWES